MTCKCYQKSSLLTVVNPAQDIVANNPINFNVNSVDTGTAIQHAAGTPTVAIAAPGLYLVSFNAVFTIGTAGNAVITLTNNGTAVPGATMESTDTAFAFTTLVTVLPSCCAVNNTANLQVIVSATGVVDNASMAVVKLA